MSAKSHPCASVVVLAAALINIASNAWAQTSSSSRPLSATVVSTYIARNGELALLVLWRGSPGWHARGNGDSSTGGGGHDSTGREVGSFSLTQGGRTLSIDIDYTASVATMLGQQVSLASTNVVLVDDVDGPSGGRIVGRHWVDPQLPRGTGSAPRTIEDDTSIDGHRIQVLTLRSIFEHKVQTLSRASAAAPVDPKHVHDAQILGAVLYVPVPAVVQEAAPDNVLGWQPPRFARASNAVTTNSFRTGQGVPPWRR